MLTDRIRILLFWIALAAAVFVPIVLAAFSPLLAWRDPVYIAAGFAGIVAMALLLVQPLLASGEMPGIRVSYGRRLHRAVGALIVLAVLAHVAGLWITSPPDVIDALLFRSPTPFSAWGVIAMWAVLATALLGAFRGKLRLRPRVWRWCHIALAVLLVGGTVIHAVLIEGTMEQVSKLALSVLVLAATAKVSARLASRPRTS